MCGGIGDNYESEAAVVLVVVWEEEELEVIELQQMT